nr:unknown Function [uncultured bacterium]
MEFRESLYAVLKSSSIWEQYTFVLPHDENDAPFPTKEFFESEECDVILAEVSYPSTGQGIEIGWADTLHIPLVCLYKKNASISQSLYTVTNKFVEYMDEEDLVKKITRVLDHIRVEMKL